MIDTILINGLWQGALITALAAVAAASLSTREATTRYAIWFTALIALATVPIISVWHPERVLVALPPPILTGTAATSSVAGKAAIAGGTWLVLFWLIGVSVALARIAFGYVRIARIVRNAAPAPNIGPDVRLSNDISIPLAAGILSPVILLPASIVPSLDPRDIASIVEHERAHIRRKDVAGNIVARLIQAFLFFNPWVYVIGDQLVKEREFACDDWAAHATGKPDNVASCLARLAQSRSDARVPLLTPSAIGSRPMVVGRIARLLNGKGFDLRINYFVLSASILALGTLALLLQTAAGLASTGTVVATSGSPSKCYAGVKPLDAAPPDISKADYRANVSANALVTIAPNGHPTGAKIVKSSGSDAIDRATVTAAMASTYSPQLDACKAVAGQYLFHVQTAP
jgi:Zn-dependent protease with chaperone function